MKRDELWARLKQYGITLSTRPDCPSDADIKIVVQCARVSPKAFADFLCSLDGSDKKPTL